mgnify:CR=1 FL=1
MDNLNLLTAISAVDGRYRNKVNELSPIVSEYGLIRSRVQVECDWLLFLCDTKEVSEITKLDAPEKTFIQDIYLNFGVEDAESVKKPRPRLTTTLKL